MELYLDDSVYYNNIILYKWLNLEVNIKSGINILKKIIRSIFILLYFIFAAAMIIGGAISGAMTLMPAEASKPCYLGYYALCSFTPYSSIILFSIAFAGAILMIVLIRYLKKK